MSSPRSCAHDDRELGELGRDDGIALATGEACVGDGLLCEIRKRRADDHYAQRSTDVAARTAEDALHERLLIGGHRVIGLWPRDAAAAQIGDRLAQLVDRRRLVGCLRSRDREAEHKASNSNQTGREDFGGRWHAGVYTPSTPNPQCPTLKGAASNRLQFCLSCRTSGRRTDADSGLPFPETRSACHQPQGPPPWVSL